MGPSNQSAVSSGCTLIMYQVRTACASFCLQTMRPSKRPDQPGGYTHHGVGPCRMGSRDEAGAVVDTRDRVVKGT